MNILLHSLLLLGGINLIAARYVYGGSNPLLPFERDLYRSPFSQYNHGVGDYGHWYKFFDDYSKEDLSKEPVITETSDEIENMKKFESFLSTLTLLKANDDDYVDERKIADASKEITNEKDADDKSENDDDNDGKNEKNDDYKSDDNDDNDDKNEKGDDDKSEKNDDDKSEKNDDDKSDNDDNDNNDDNDTKEDKEEEEAEIIANSNEENPIKPIVTADESLFLVDDDDDDDTGHVESISVANVPLEKPELSEKEIRELTAFLVTLSTMEDLLKVAEHIEDEDNSQDVEELFEQKLKEVDNFMGLFVNTLDAILEETSKVGKDSGKSENDDDYDDNDKDDKDDSKDDKDDNDDNDDNDDDKKEKAASSEDNNIEDASVSVDFHSVDTQTNTKNMDTHKYNIIERSTTTDPVFKPTSSPYTPESYSSAGNPNAAIIHAYVEEREQLDALQENLLENKLNMDKDFYHIITNEGNDKDLQKFGNDIAAMRENIFKMKQSIDAMQDIKSKLYFHQLIKSALNNALVN